MIKERQNIRLAHRLIIDIQKECNKWDERSCFTLKGVDNLSMSDMDTLLLYARTYIRCGSFEGLMKPVGNVAEVLKKYDIL